MSLRSRVFVAIVLVLGLTAAIGAAVAGLRAHASVRAELGAAMAGARRSLQGELKDPHNRGADALRRLVQAFDGDRHLRAALISGERQLLASTPARPLHAAPAPFAALISPHVAPVRLPVPGQAGLAVRLEPAPEADLADAWLNFADLLMVLALACALGCGLVLLLIGQALRPLDDLVASFEMIGAGDYRIRVGEGGAREIASIGRAFNRMAGQLDAMSGRNRLLEAQLERLQDEERAELARDLHDDVGPYLFAVNVDAAMVGQLAAAGRTQEIPPLVKAIQGSIAHMQAQVRDILGRLRPAQIVELGLEPAIADLVAFWRERAPGVEFEVSVKADGARLTSAVQEAAFRIVQEGLSNAVRHGCPDRVEVRLQMAHDGPLEVIVRDNGQGGEGAMGGHTAGHGRRGFGLTGMRERAAQAGGKVEIERGDGWTVRAILPAKGRRGRRAA